MDEVVAARLEDFRRRALGDDVRLNEQSLIIGSLLTGDSFLFGKPVALAWPEGLPSGMTEEKLREFGQHILDQARRDSGETSTMVGENINHG